MNTGPVTAREVRNLMAIGLKSEEELRPDFPATGESAGFTEPECQSKGAPHINGIAVTGNDSATCGTSALPAEDKDGGITKLRATSTPPIDVFADIQRRFFQAK